MCVRVSSELCSNRFPWYKRQLFLFSLLSEKAKNPINEVVVCVSLFHRSHVHHNGRSFWNAPFTGKAQETITPWNSSYTELVIVPIV